MPPSAVVAGASRTTPAERQFTINIQAGINLLQNALNPKGAFLGQAYSFQLTTDNPAAATSWSVTGGALPPGITLNSSNGLLSGTPTAALVRPPR